MTSVQLRKLHCVHDVSLAVQNRTLEPTPSEVFSDWIAAPITATGGAIAAVRVSGTGVHEIGPQLFSPWPSPVVSGRVSYGRFETGDDGLLIPLDRHFGYCGEEGFELFGHGSPAGIRLLMERLDRLGVRRARPGEFTERAFRNGRLDLTQAMAVADIVAAETERQFEAATRVRSGSLRAAIGNILEGATQLIATLEAYTDFEEELGPPNYESLAAQADEIQQAAAALARRLHEGQILKEGFRVALVGAPNAGKSSLLNALLGRERAIVTEIPGTTRDTIEEWIELDGVPIQLIDTAGIRVTADPVERLGIERTNDAVAAADLVLRLIPTDLSSWDLFPAGDKDEIIIQTKIDLAPSAVRSGLAVSTRTGEGLTELKNAIRARLPSQLAIPSHPEQRSALARIASELGLARDAIRHELAFDLPVTHLRTVLAECRQLLGETGHFDALTEIFRRFCIGK